ncbi:hypothetical protein [Hungatella sp.]|uniref:hypothetical protein n=1 Tax=Hungatella sp. TaxID=2613924 RepID=UPI003993199A
MFLILLGVFWLTITGANYPSELLSTGLFWVEDRISELFLAIGMPVLVNDLLVHGVYRVLAWGNIGYAASNGNLFPVVYAAGRLRLPSKSCV